MSEANDSSDMTSMAGKAAIVTGGTTGIGRATAARLARAGAKVLIFGRHEDALQEAVRAGQDAADAGGEVHGVTADLTQPDDIARVFAEADDRFGQLDVLVNNAGVAKAKLEEGAWDDWQQTVTTNLTGLIACTHHALPRLRKSRGHVVLVGSMSADLRNPGSAIYSATKAAVQAFGESLRKLVNPDGVRVTVLEPGATDTPMQGDDLQERREKVESGDMLDADDIARAVEYCLIQPARCDVVFMQVRPTGQAI